MAPRRAVVIGINEYKDPEMEKLTGAVNDATELRDRLKASGDFDIPDEHFLRGSEATSTAIRKAISDLFWKDDRSDLSLFYFSGHGLHDEYGNGYIAPYDVDSREPLVCGIRMGELTQLLLAAKNKKAAVAILDCCFSGVATEGKSGSTAQEPPLRDWFQELQKEGVGEGRIVFASSGKDQKSRERRECVHELNNLAPHDHGAFSFQLLEGIDGKAVDSNGAVTLQQLHAFIDREMQSDAYHKMSFFGSSLTQAQQIIIAQPSQWTNDQRSLEQVRGCLQADDPDAIFYAATVVNTILARSPNLKVVCDVRDQINDQFRKYQNPAISWLTERRLKLFDCRDFVIQLRQLAGDLTVQTFAAAKEGMQGLLASLCSVSYKPSTAKDEASFIQELRAHASSGRQSTSGVAKPQAERQQLA
jgi:uncharacterized caspase-like protein